MLTSVMFEHIGRGDASQEDTGQRSAYIDQFGWASVVCSQFASCQFQHRGGESALANIGSHGTHVGCVLGYMLKSGAWRCAVWC